MTRVTFEQLDKQEHTDGRLRGPASPTARAICLRRTSRPGGTVSNPENILTSHWPLGRASFAFGEAGLPSGPQVRPRSPGQRSATPRRPPPRVGRTPPCVQHVNSTKKSAVSALRRANSRGCARSGYPADLRWTQFATNAVCPTWAAAFPRQLHLKKRCVVAADGLQPSNPLHTLGVLCNFTTIPFAPATFGTGDTGLDTQRLEDLMTAHAPPRPRPRPPKDEGRAIGQKLQ